MLAAMRQLKRQGLTTYQWEAGVTMPGAGWFSVAYGNGRFVAIKKSMFGSGGDNYAAISLDAGKTWGTPALISLPPNYFARGIAFSNGYFVVSVIPNIAVVNHYVARSVDGVNWSVSAFPNQPVSTVSAANGRLFIGRGQGGPNYGINVSVDGGASWTTVNTPFDVNGTVTYGPGYYVYSDQNGHATSADGLSWSARLNHPTPISNGDIAFGNGFFLTGSGGSVGNASFCKSFDGVNFSVNNSGLNLQSMNGIYFTGTKFVMPSTFANIGVPAIVTSDGVSFVQTLPTPRPVLTPYGAYGAGVLIVFGGTAATQTGSMMRLEID